MNEGYGNISWTFYVYGAYVVTGLTLVVYAWFARQSRESSAKSLRDEFGSSDK